ncbi:MAG: pseudouridine synthase [Patescibacteria group bacterium]
MRLNQYIAYLTSISRRQADEFIKKGLVEVNGEIGQLNTQASEADYVRIYKQEKWQELSKGGSNSQSKTVLYYKPIFTLCSHKPEIGKKTIYDLLPKVYKNLKFAGRLDYMSEGLMVLTNDGKLVQELTHPKNDSQKEYLVGLKYQLRIEDMKNIRQGMEIDDYKLNPVDASLYLAANSGNTNTPYNYLGLQPNFWWYKFILTEGRNNQIRKLCSAVGQKVLRLVRVKQGNYFLDKKLFDRKIVEVN